MVVQDHQDPGLRRIGGVQPPQEGDELPTAMAWHDGAMHVAGEQVETRHQGERPVTPVFVVAPEGGMASGCRGQVGRHRADRLNARLFVIRDEGAQAPLRVRRVFAQDLHQLVHEQHFGHLPIKLRVAAFQVVGDLVRSELLPRQQLRDGAAGQLRQARMSGRHRMLAGVASQQAGRPQLLWIPQARSACDTPATPARRAPPRGSPADAPSVADLRGRPAPRTAAPCSDTAPPWVGWSPTFARSPTRYRRPHRPTVSVPAPRGGQVRSATGRSLPLWPALPGSSPGLHGGSRTAYQRLGRSRLGSGPRGDYAARVAMSIWNRSTSVVSLTCVYNDRSCPECSAGWRSIRTAVDLRCCVPRRRRSPAPRL